MRAIRKFFAGFFHNHSPSLPASPFEAEQKKIASIAATNDIAQSRHPSEHALGNIVAPPTPQRRVATTSRPIVPVNVQFRRSLMQVVAIGASTGGPEAILSVVRDLPKNTPGIVIVQHMPPGFTRMFAERLDANCKMAAREARDGDRVQPGVILLAEGNSHMRVVRDRSGYAVRLDPSAPEVSGHRPSVDVLFASVAKAVGPYAVGVILTGMGADGAKELLSMRRAGAHTIGQDEASCAVYGMPMVAYEIGAVAEQLPLAEIPAAIIRSLVK